MFGTAWFFGLTQAIRQYLRLALMIGLAENRPSSFALREAPAPPPAGLLAEPPSVKPEDPPTPPVKPVPPLAP